LENKRKNKCKKNRKVEKKRKKTKKKKKKGKSWKKNAKKKEKKRRNALWITVVIHNTLCLGNSDSPTPFRVLLIFIKEI
jgi:hypothetical protein